MGPSKGHAEQFHALPRFPAAPLVLIFLALKGKAVWGKVNWASEGYVSSGLQSLPPELNYEASYFGPVFEGMGAQCGGRAKKSIPKDQERGAWIKDRHMSLLLPWFGKGISPVLLTLSYHGLSHHWEKKKEQLWAAKREMEWCRAASWPSKPGHHLSLVWEPPHLSLGSLWQRSLGDDAMQRVLRW